MGANQTIYTEIRKRYMTGWTPLTTEFPNESFTIPDASMWCRFNIVTGPEKQIGFGDDKKMFRTRGQLVVQMFAPMNTGAIDLLEQADILANAMRAWAGATVACYEATVREIGNDKFGWYQVNVIVPFKSDAVH
jgi:hypothetical protein